MNNRESLAFVRSYFDELFEKWNVDALDVYLDKEYFDDDIADPGLDHIQSAKEYLEDLFRKHPTIGVEVKDAMIHDDVITAYLDWFVIESDVKRIIRKGIAIFVLREQKILKRHTYVYYQT